MCKTKVLRWYTYVLISPQHLINVLHLNRNTVMYRRSPGRRDERPFSDQHVPGRDFDPPWRGPEKHGPPHWNDVRLPREGPPNDWGRYNEEFIPHGDRRPPLSEEYKPRRSPSEYLNRQRSSPGPPPPFGYVERRRLSPKAFDEMQAHSPRRLPRERLPSPASHFDHHHRHPSPDWARNEHGVGRPERQESGRGRGPRGGPRGDSPRGTSFNRPQERRPDRMEHRNYPEELNEHYHNRSLFSDRYRKHLNSISLSYLSEDHRLRTGDEKTRRLFAVTHRRLLKAVSHVFHTNLLLSLCVISYN